MTALSQAEDKERADKLGADKYLVKSQVTLEDVARVAKEVLTGEVQPSAGPSATDSTSTSTTPTTNSDAPTASPAPAVATDTPDASTQQVAPSATDELDNIQKQLADFENQPSATPPTPVASTVPPSTPPVPTDDTNALNTADTGQATTPAPTPSEDPISVKQAPGVAEVPAVAPEIKIESAEDKTEVNDSARKVINPINDLSKPPTDLNDLAAKEEAVGTANVVSPTVINPADPLGNTVITPSDPSKTL